MKSILSTNFFENLSELFTRETPETFIIKFFMDTYRGLIWFIKFSVLSAISINNIVPIVFKNRRGSQLIFFSKAVITPNTEMQKWNELNDLRSIRKTVHCLRVTAVYRLCWNHSRKKWCRWLDLEIIPNSSCFPSTRRPVAALLSSLNKDSNVYSLVVCYRRERKVSRFGQKLSVFSL